MTIRVARLFETVCSFSLITQSVMACCENVMDEVKVEEVSPEVVEVKLNEAPVTYDEVLDTIETECTSVVADSERKGVEEEDECGLVYVDDFIDQELNADVSFDDFVPDMEDFVDVTIAGHAIPTGVELMNVSGGSSSTDAGSVSNALPKDVDARSVSDVRGLRKIADQHLVDAGQGMEKHSSEGNDRWALRRLNMMRSELGLDVVAHFGDLPLQEQDCLLRELFARVVKVNGEDYPSASLMNLWNCFNRIIKRQSDHRSVTGGKNILPNDFHINDHVLFSSSRMVLKAAIKRSAKKGLNKRVKKVEVITEAMEQAILGDIDHQISSSTGCQKCVAFYCMVRLGVRGGKKLYNLQRTDLSVEVDTSDKREFVKFVEQESKNNKYTMKRTNEDQFWATYYSYKPDFVLSVKQYMRHLPPAGEGVSEDLFLNAIPNPASNVWYNRVHKVSADRVANWMKSMLRIVGIDENLLVSNKSGRATLITRMAAQGVPDHVGMLIMGHHTQDGYSRYDRTKDLKMKAATIVSATPGLSYDDALKSVSGSFLSEKLVGNSELLKPLMAHVADKSNMQLALKTVKTTKDFSTTVSESEVGKSQSFVNALSLWHEDYDNIDWEAEVVKNPSLGKALGRAFGGKPIVAQVSGGTSMAGNSFANMHGCTFNISFVAPPCVEDKENKMPATK